MEDTKQLTEDQFVEIVRKNIDHFRTQPFKSSLDYFINTGKITGSLFLAIKEIYKEIKN